MPGKPAHVAGKEGWHETNVEIKNEESPVHLYHGSSCHTVSHDIYLLSDDKGVPDGISELQPDECQEYQVVGLDNFSKLFAHNTSNTFYSTMLNTVKWVGISLFVQFTVGFAMALLLKKKFKVPAFIRADFLSMGCFGIYYRHHVALDVQRNLRRHQ